MRTVLALGCLTTVLLATPALAQVPAAPTAPAAPATPGAPAVPSPTDAASAAGQAKGFLPQLCACLEKCKQKFCASQLGMLTNNALLPLNTFAGGMIPSCCPTGPTAADLAKQGAEGTAAKIQAEEANAKARRAAVKYLGTVDCHYYPEAEASLIEALRTDRNECVRWEAAMALGNGCCCTKRTIAALVLVVTGSEKDSNPAETSERVRASAYAALEHCVGCYRRIQAVPEAPPERPPARPEVPPTGATSLIPGDQVRLSAYYTRIESSVSHEQLVAEGRRVIDAWKTATVETPRQAVPTGHRNLYDLWQNAELPPAAPEGTAPIQTASSSSPPPLRLPQMETMEPPTLVPVPQQGGR